MRTFTINKPVSVLFFFLLLLLTPSPSFALSFSLSFSQYRAALYLAHSLATRVADLRASRGDFEGSARAQTIARKIQSVQGLRFGKLSWNLCWDYVRNYTWRGVTTASFADLASAISDLNEFLRSLNEMSPAESNTERAAWVSGNYNRTFTVSRLLFDKLLNRFQQGLLWEIIETMQKEVTEGDLFRDCLEVGTNDLKGLIKVLKDISLQYSASASNRNEL